MGVMADERRENDALRSRLAELQTEYDRLVVEYGIAEEGTIQANNKVLTLQQRLAEAVEALEQVRDILRNRDRVLPDAKLIIRGIEAGLAKARQL